MSASLTLRKRAWARWLPWRLFLGPIFQKEVTVSGRRKGVYATRCGYTLVLALVTGIAFYGATEDFSWHSSTAAKLEAMQEIAPIFGEVFGWMQILLLTVIGAVMTSSAFSEEKTNRTLHSLMTTPLLSAQIVFGKLSSRLLQIVILALIPMPVLLGLRVYGGLEPGRVLAGTMLAIVSAGFAASISLLLSIFNKRPWSVIVLTGVAVFVVQVAPIIVTFGAGVRTGIPNLDIAMIAFVALVSPQFAFAIGMPGVPAMIPGFARLDPSMLWVATCGAIVLLTIGVCLVSSAVLRPMTLREKSRDLPEAEESAAQDAAAPVKKKAAHKRRRARGITFSRIGIFLTLLVLGAAFAGFIGVLAEQPIGFWIGAAMPLVGVLLDVIVPAGRRRTSREVSDRPIFWRELRSSFVGSRGGVIVLGVFVAGILYLAYREAPIDQPELHLGILGGFLGVQLLAAATMTTGRIATERDARTWDTLLCTPLSARRIVWEKLSASFLQLMPVPAVMIAHMIVYMLLGVLPATTVLSVTVMTLSATAMLCCTGLFLGMWRGKSTFVAVMNLAFGGILWLGLPVGTAILAEIWGVHGDQPLTSVTLFFNPVYLSMESIDSSVSDRFWSNTYRLGSFRMSQLEFTFLTLCSAATLSLIGFAAYAQSVALLRRRSLRAA